MYYNILGRPPVRPGQFVRDLASLLEFVMGKWAGLISLTGFLIRCAPNKQFGRDAGITNSILLFQTRFRINLNGMRAMTIGNLPVNTIRAVSLLVAYSANICPIRPMNRDLGQIIRGMRVNSAVVSHEIMLLKIVICIVYDDVRVSATKAEGIYRDSPKTSAWPGNGFGGNLELFLAQ